MDKSKGKGKARHPLPHLDFPIVPILLLWDTLGPHRSLHCEDILDDIFPLPPYSVDDPDLPPHYKDLFPPNYTPFPDINATPQSITNTRLPIPSIPLEPPPPHNSLFATAAPSDSAIAPPDTWNDPYCWDTDASLDLDL